MQLVKNNVDIFDPIKNKIVQKSDVKEKFGVRPEQVIDVQALAGDKSDNIPGVPGIGIKIAAELIKQFGSIEQLLKNIEKIKQNKRREKLNKYRNDTYISKKLVTLETKIPFLVNWNSFKLRSPRIKNLKIFLKNQGFENLLNDLENNYFKLKENSKNNNIKYNILPFKHKKTSYTLINNERDLQCWLTKNKNIKILSLNLTTDFLNPTHTKIAGISLSHKDSESIYIPLYNRIDKKIKIRNINSTKVNFISLQNIKKILQPILLNPTILKVGQNTKYDLLVLKQNGFKFFQIEDNMIISYIINGIKHKHRLDELAKKYLNYSIIPSLNILDDTIKQYNNFHNLSLKLACDYACQTSDITLQVYKILKTKLISNNMIKIYQDIDLPLIPVLIAMEKTGITIDVILLKKMSNEFKIQLNKLETNLFKITGKNINLSSPKEVSTLLFNKLQFNATEKNKKTGIFKTSNYILNKLSNNIDNIPYKIIEWRKIAKLKTTYTDSLLKQINKKTGRIHTYYSTTKTLTGRLASIKPNLQNIPIKEKIGKRIREAFIVPEKYSIVSFDYSQIEIRLLAYLARIDNLKKALQQGDDIHQITASQTFKIPIEQVNSDIRYKAKAINFGIIYGISAFGLANQLNIERKEAENYIKIYLDQYKGILNYMKDKKEEAYKYGYVKTLTGRRCYIQNIQEKNLNNRQFAERQAINAPLQGSASDIIKKAMISIYNTLKKYNLKSRMLLQIHDELIFESPKHEVENLKNIVVPIMEKIVNIEVALKVNVSVGNNWQEV